MSDDRLPERVFANESPHAIHTRASENAHQQIVHNRSDLGPSTLVVISILALVIGACGVIMGINLAKQDREDADFKDMKTQLWLKDDALTKFEQGPFADLKAQVIANQSRKEK